MMQWVMHEIRIFFGPVWLRLGGVFVALFEGWQPIWRITTHMTDVCAEGEASSSVPGA
jgi:hypothetical protein